MPGPDMLVAAISGRALAASAARAGYRVAVIDLFNDTDTRAHSVASIRASGSLRSGFRSEALLKAATDLAVAPTPLVYGSGFDRRTRLLTRLAGQRTLLGNAPATVRRLKQPATFVHLLEGLGIPHPETRLECPDHPRGWLAKRIGGAGGAHIRPAQLAPRDGSYYYQRYQPGRPVSALFLADGISAKVLGFSEQWSDPGPGDAAFRFGGVVFPAVVREPLRSKIVAAVEALARECRLVGANSADLLLHEDGFSLLEINPRPGATVDAFDSAFRTSLFGLHVEACAGRLPPTRDRLTRVGASASAIVYADRRLVAPPADFWPDWAADIPEPGSVIQRGHPVCTARAVAGDPRDARRQAVQRCEEIVADLRRRKTRYRRLPRAADYAQLTAD